MCGRYVSPSDAEIEREWHIGRGSPEPFGARYNVPPTAPAPIIRQGDDDLELAIARWGLLPRNAPEPKTHLATFNARIETVAKAYTYRWPFLHRRCLVPAAGWYEWETIDVPGQKKPRKQPWFIHAEDGHPLAFAGLWDRWQKGDQVVDSFTIIVKGSTDAMGRVHDRMAVVLPPKDYAAWLDPKRENVDDVLSILARTSAKGLVMHRVTPAVSNVKSRGAKLIEPIDGEVVSAS